MIPPITSISKCRVCSFTDLVPLLSLGDLYVSDFPVDGNQEILRAPLDLLLCNRKDGGCGLVQLRHSVSGEYMYRQYWYRSGVNKSMTDELVGIAKTVNELVALKSGDHVIDIGANDGTLLRGYGVDGLQTIGFEPAKNLSEYNSNGTTVIIPDFFNANSWKERFGSVKAKAITAIAMFYDLEDPNSFVSDIVECLDDEGVFIIQMSYLPSMLSQNAFDNICHEHVEYYSLLSLEFLLNRNGLEVFDVDLNDVNGGSYRIYIRHRGKGRTLCVARGAEERVAALRKSEEDLGLNAIEVYHAFAERVRALKDKTRSFIQKVVAEGKKVYVYGASTKGNTLLQYYDIDHTLIEAAADRNPIKWGRFTVGTNIPIISEEQARTERPDYFFVLPWHFMKEFKERETGYLGQGGSFIVPLPEFMLVSKE